ncbi:OmpA family protein [Candidatus Dependentiae bacterium]|nr:OmpA family protein [Candidatus Dependentiae bacterium]
METKKNLSLLLLALFFLLPSCGKKKVCKLDNKKTAMTDSESNINLASKTESIPTVKEEVEDFFDDGSISEFAMTENDEFAEDKEELENLFAEEEKPVETASATSNELSENTEALTWTQEDEAEEEAGIFKTVYFDINKNDVRQDQKESIQENIQTAKEIVDKGKNIVIQGHCCQLGPDAYNLTLSEKRANAIKKEMVKNGIPEDKIKTIGCGKEMPVVWSDSPTKQEKVKELAPNRRSEILVG